MPEAYRKAPWNAQGRFSHHAYDPRHGKLYAAGLFGRLRVYDLHEPAR